MQGTLRAVALLLALTPQAYAADDAVDAGAYVAARIAGMNSDFAEAASWYARALIADPGNAALQDGAMLSNINAGRLETAVNILNGAGPGGGTSQMAEMTRLADQAQRGDYAALLQLGADGQGVSRLLDGLLIGWAQLGDGRMSEAQESFDNLAEGEGMAVFALYHKALALASVGDFEAAEAIFSGPTGEALESLRRAAIAHAQILSQLERNPDAVLLLNRVFAGGKDPGIVRLIKRLEAGEPVPFDIVRTPKDGLAEVFFSLATALNAEQEDTLTLVHARIAAWLRPDHTEAQLLTAGILNRLEQPELATETYALISPDDPSFHVAEIGRAFALLRLDRTEAAIEVMTGLSRSHAGIVEVHQELGNILRGEEKYEAAIVAYDAAIALLEGNLTPNDWDLFYARGICQERQKRWDKAEADFRKSLELQPDQAMVLNYMGYSFVEMNRNLDEALSMIERAIKLQPENGAIVDSYAWALFTLGRFQEALEPMERASLLEPVDPVVTDHLGDIYWAVGRRLEAQFEWHRALSFDPEDDAAERIRRKIAVGLDAVLAEEGAAPIEAQTAADGN